MHCFSMPERLDECLERGYAISFAGNVTYPSAARPRRRPRARVPDERLLVETDAPYLTPQAVRKRAQPARLRRAHAARSSPSCAASAPRGARRRRRAQRRRAVRLGMSAVAAGAPAQPSLRRMRRFGVRPDRDLGQNFLIDSNILGVIERAAELAPEDVVLEIGGGLGVLSEHLAERVAHVHVVEVDERLRERAARRDRRRTRT